MIRKIAPVIASLLLVLGACGGETVTTETESPPIDADGEELFMRTVLARNGGCITCHSLAADKVLVGPPLADIGATAAGRIPGVSARDYLLESIVDPDVFLTAGFEAGRMPGNREGGLSPSEIAALIDYMLTLRAE